MHIDLYFSVKNPVNTCGNCRTEVLMVSVKEHILQGQNKMKNSLFPRALHNLCVLKFCFWFGGSWSLISLTEFGKYSYYVGFTESYVSVE